MRKVCIKRVEICDNCIDCSWSKGSFERHTLSDPERYICLHPKLTGELIEVTEYYNEDTGCHPNCPLPNLPDNPEMDNDISDEYHIESILAQINTREIRLIKT